MKTSVEIDSKKLLLAKKLTETSTLKETVDKALDALIAQQRRFSILEILGTPFYNGNLENMRTQRGRARR